MRRVAIPCTVGGLGLVAGWCAITASMSVSYVNDRRVHTYYDFTPSIAIALAVAGATLFVAVWLAVRPNPLIGRLSLVLGRSP